MDGTLFAKRLVRLREMVGLTQSALADRIGVARETVYRWESGKHGTPHRRMKDIYRALGVTEEQFWDPEWESEPRGMGERPYAARRFAAGPYLGIVTNEDYMALECPRCGATDFSAKARYCRQCAFPLYNYCMHPDMESRHTNMPDAAYCEECARPTFWSREYVTLEEVLGERAMHSAHNAEGEQHRT